MDYFIVRFFRKKSLEIDDDISVNVKKVNKGTKKEAILLFPFWTGKLSAYSSLVRKLKEYDIFFCDYPNEVFSEDISLSKDCMQRILEDSFSLQCF